MLSPPAPITAPPAPSLAQHGPNVAASTCKAASSQFHVLGSHSESAQPEDSGRVGTGTEGGRVGAMLARLGLRCMLPRQRLAAIKSSGRFEACPPPLGSSCCIAMAQGHASYHKTNDRPEPLSSMLKGAAGCSRHQLRVRNKLSLFPLFPSQEPHFQKHEFGWCDAAIRTREG